MLFKARAATRELGICLSTSKLTIKAPGRRKPYMDLAQDEVEAELMKAVEELVERRRVFDAPSLEELVNLTEECDDEDSPYPYPFEDNMKSQPKCAESGSQKARPNSWPSHCRSNRPVVGRVG